MKEIVRGELVKTMADKNAQKVGNVKMDKLESENGAYRSRMCKDCKKKKYCKEMPRICAKKGLKWK